MKLSPEDQLILSVIKLYPSALEIKLIDDQISQIRDWDYFIKTIINRGIAPLLYKKLPLLSSSFQLPEHVKIKLQQAYYKTLSRNTILYEHFRKIAEAFSLQHIPIIALKGVYVSEWLYQDIGLRQFSDIDLLIKEENALACLAILEKMGYTSSAIVSKSHLSNFILSNFETDNEIVHYPPRILNGVSIEIHIKLFRSAEKYNLNIHELWEQSIPANINNINVRALTTYDLLIHLILHLNKHFQGGKVQFTSFNDVTNLIERFADTIDWNDVAARCRRYNCEEIVFKIIVLIYKYIPINIPLNVIQKYEILLKEDDEQLFCDVLRGNIHSSVVLSGHFGYLGKIQSFVDKVRYLGGVIFPSNAFMMQRYQIQRSSQVLIYYPYRYYLGIKEVLLYLKKLKIMKKKSKT